MKDATCTRVTDLNTAADQRPSDLQAATVCLLRWVSGTGSHMGYEQRHSLCPRLDSLPFSTLLCAPESGLGHPSFPAFEHWAQMIRRLGKRWESEKRKDWGSLPARLWFGSGYTPLLPVHSYLGAPLMLIATSSPCALVPVGLIRMDYSSGFCQPLAAAWGVTEQPCRTLDRGQKARSWFSFSQQLPPMALWAGI